MTGHLIHGAIYRVSQCFSEFDVPRGLYLTQRNCSRRGIADAVVGRELQCQKVSNSGQSGWFDALAAIDAEMYCVNVGVAIHRRHLTFVRSPLLKLFHVQLERVETRVANVRVENEMQALHRASQLNPGFVVTGVVRAAEPDGGEVS